MITEHLQTGNFYEMNYIWEKTFAGIKCAAFRDAALENNY